MLNGYIKGMLEISVEGVNLEKFINRCNQNGVVMYNVTREKYDFLRCTINLNDFKTIARVNRELKCRIRVKKRYGAKFFFNRLKKRKAFVIGAAIFVIFLTILSSSIWRIDIEGIDRIYAGKIIDVVNEMNAGIGIFKAKCDTKALELQIKKALPEVDWVIVDINGVVMNIKVVETVDGVEMIDKTPCSIISEVTGEIVSINALKGDAAVKAGDKIVPGQLLINGIIEREEAPDFHRVINAIGHIKARVTYTGNASIKLDELDEKVYTEKEKCVYSITVFGKKLALNKVPDFEYYDKVEEEYNLFSEGRLFPIVATRTVYREYTPFTAEELKEKAQESVMKRAYNDAVRTMPISAKIETQDIKYSFDASSNTYSALMEIVAIQDVGVKKELTQTEIDEITMEKGDKKTNER